MKIDELNAASRVYMRRTTIAIFVSLAAFIVPAVVFAYLKGGKQLNDPDEALLYFSLMVPGPLLLLVSLWVIHKWCRGHPHLNCPYCEKSLLTAKPTTIATRNCGYCGRRVLDEPDPLDTKGEKLPEE